MTKTLIILFLSVLSTNIWAQQTPQYSLQMLNPYHINPAYAATSNQLEVYGGVRMQWVGLDGSPSSQYLDAFAPIPYLQSSIGLNLETRQIGLFEQTKFALSYAYNLKISTKTQIGIGLRGAIQTITLDGNRLLTPDSEYTSGLVNLNDNTLTTGKVSDYSLLSDIGVYLKSSGIEGGISLLNVTSLDLVLNQNNVNNFSYDRHLALFMAYTCDLGQDFALRPSVGFKTNITESQLDIAVELEYDEQFMLGGLLRGYNQNTLDALGIFTGWKFLEHWQLAYAYDIPLSTLNIVQQGSHEIMLKYNFGKTLGKAKMPKVIHTPRLL